MSDKPKKRKSSKKTERTLRIDQPTLVEQMRKEQQYNVALVVIGGLNIGEVIPLVDEVTRIGRDPDSQVVIRDDGISRNHAEIRKKDKNFVLYDTESKNGVFVEGDKITEHILKNGDKVLLGRRTVLKYVEQDPFEQRYREQMHHFSVRDPLTGAYNRKHLDEFLTTECSYASRHEIPLSLLMIDIDHFKKINDHWGHLVGDEVLVSVVELLKEEIRNEDFLARYGGEEFVVIARGVNAKGAQAFAERLRSSVEKMILRTTDTENIPVTVSIGVCTMEKDESMSPEELVSKADSLLYKAKQNGRNCIECLPE